PDSAIACLAAPAANLVCRPRTFQPSASRPALEASQFLTSAEILVGNLLASKMVVKPTPDFPSLRPDQTSSTLCPIGFTEPTPVTTTRLRMKPPATARIEIVIQPRKRAALKYRIIPRSVVRTRAIAAVVSQS